MRRLRTHLAPTILITYLPSDARRAAVEVANGFAAGTLVDANGKRASLVVLVTDGASTPVEYFSAVVTPP